MFKYIKFHFPNLLICAIMITSCQNKPKPIIEQKSVKKIEKNAVKSVANEFILNDENAIPFFFEYDKQNKENKVRIETRFGNIDIQLFNETPYHRSNFIYLTKKNILMGLHFIEW